ncbi:hypothetical protein [Nostoc commune]|nr:hypothetical protein [Nostoc commune]
MGYAYAPGKILIAKSEAGRHASISGSGGRKSAIAPPATVKTTI